MIVIVCTGQGRHRPRRLGRMRIVDAHRLAVEIRRVIWRNVSDTSATFRWRCPSCGRDVRKGAPEVRGWLESGVSAVDISRIP